MLVAVVASWHHSRIWCWRSCSDGAPGRFFGLWHTAWTCQRLQLVSCQYRLVTVSLPVQESRWCGGGDLPTTFLTSFHLSASTAFKKCCKIQNLVLLLCQSDSIWGRFALTMAWYCLQHLDFLFSFLFVVLLNTTVKSVVQRCGLESRGRK